MTYKITHKNSTVSGTPPTAGDIDVGEIAINAADATLYVKDTNGNIKEFANTDTTGTSSSVQFLQSGTGATQRTVESKLRDIISVKDFGAEGDGVTDDTAAIQAAISASTGTIYFPEGTYTVSTGLTAAKPTEILGEGAATRINYTGTGTLFTFEYSSGANADQDITAPFAVRNIFLIKLASASGEVAECCIELKYTGAAAIIGANDKLYLDNVYIGTNGFPGSPENTYWKKGLYLNRSAGVYATDLSIANNSSVAETTANVYGVHIKNDLASHNLIRTFSASNYYIQRFNRCIFIEAGTTSSIESIYLVNGEILGNYGIYATKGDAFAVAQTHFDVITQAFYLTNTNVTRVTGCDIRSQRTQPAVANALIYCSGNYSTWTGNACFGQNQTPGVFEIAGSFATITGNIIVGSSGTSRALLASSGSAYVYVSSNSYANVIGDPPVVDTSGVDSIFYAPNWKWNASNGAVTVNNGKLQLTAAGFLKASQDGNYQGNIATTYEHQLLNALSASNVVRLYAKSNAFTGTIANLNCDTAASSSYNFLIGYSAHGSAPDLEYQLRGDGNAFADGSWSGGGADYAEYFEWLDGNPNKEDRRGLSVVLEGDKIRKAAPGETPIGVISGNPSVVGDSAWNKWSEKYLRDQFGSYIFEDYEVENEEGNTIVQKRRKLNPDYDPKLKYVPREQRPEWDCVGLIGKLRVLCSQVVNPRWVKMRDINNSVSEYLLI